MRERPAEMAMERLETMIIMSGQAGSARREDGWQPMKQGVNGMNKKLESNGSTKTEREENK